MRKKLSTGLKTNNQISIFILLFLALITSTFVDKSRDDFKENTIPSFNEICYHNEASAYNEITNLGISELSVIVEKSYDLNLECWWKITRSNYSVNEPLNNVDQLIIFKKIPSNEALIGAFVQIILLVLFIKKGLLLLKITNRNFFYILLLPVIFFVYIKISKNIANFLIISLFIENIIYLFLFNKTNFEIYSKYRLEEKFKTHNLIFVLFIAIIYQTQSLNIEIVDWDTSSFLIVAQDLFKGNLPYEFQWESKGPLFYFLYALPELFFDKSILGVKIFNDLVFLLVVISIYFASLKITKNYSFSGYVSLIFILFTSISFEGHPGYSEIYVILFLGVVINLIFEENKNKLNIFLIGFFLSLATLISISSLLFVLLIGLFELATYKFDLKKIIQLGLGFLIPYSVVVLIYSLNNSLSSYIITNFIIPFSYVENNENFYEIYKAIFIKSINNENLKYILYFFLLFFTTKILSILVNIPSLKSFNQSSIFVMLLITISLYVYGAAGRGYWHHILYFIFFMTIFFNFVDTKIIKKLLSIYILYILITTLPNATILSYQNIINYDKSNYPVFNTYEILSKDYKINNIVSLDNHLIHYYFDIPSSYYMVHPSFLWEDLENVFYRMAKLNYIEFNKPEDVFEADSDLVICMNLEVQKNRLYLANNSKFQSINNRCSLTSLDKNYIKVDTPLLADVYVRRGAKK